MSEEFSEDFVLEEGAAPNRTFLILAGSLIGLFIIIAGFILGFALLQRNGQSEEVALRLTENAEILAANALVTQTVQAMQTEAARPTNTPEPTFTTAPTDTPEPTPEDTPTLAVEVAEAVETPDLTATSEAAEALITSTPASGAEAAPSGTLPETGVETWIVAAAAIILVAVLSVARRLRTG
jgi:hypothetical protein